jgi:hypothetical protein
VTAFTTRIDGEAPEAEIARHLATRGLWVAPVLVGAAGLIWGIDGSLSSAYGVGLVIVNFLLAAAILSTAARISLAAVMAGVLFGYVLRLGLITVAVIAVKDTGWVLMLPLGLTIIVSHLGLLFWETRFVSASLAFPGLEPGKRSLGSTKE